MAVSKVLTRHAELDSASLDELILLSLRFRIKFGMTVKLTFETASFYTNAPYNLARCSFTCGLAKYSS